MNNMNSVSEANSIMWSKWTDPFAKNPDGKEYVPEDEVSRFDNININEKGIDQTDYDGEEMEYEGQNNPILMTPHGAIPLKPWNDSSKYFNFWMADCNFSITEEIFKTLDEMPGVEGLDVYTRYRFRIAVGNLFKFQNVRQSIEKALCVNNIKNQPRTQNELLKLPKEVKERIDNIIRIHLCDYPYWAVYVVPNGEIDFTFRSEDTEVYKEALAMAGGKLFEIGDIVE